MAMPKNSSKICEDARPCFARNSKKMCRILENVYNDDLCPFCKEDKDGECKNMQ